MRLARMPQVERQFASADVLAAYDRSLAELERLGAEIVSPELPFLFADVAAFNLRIMAAESYALYHELIATTKARRSRRKGRRLSGRDRLAPAPAAVGAWRGRADLTRPRAWQRPRRAVWRRAYPRGSPFFEPATFVPLAGGSA